MLNQKIINLLKREFEVASVEESLSLPLTLVHRKTGLQFQYIPGGEFEMGLSKEEEKAAQKIDNPIPANISEMRPVRQVTVGSFLRSRFPLLYGFAKYFLNLEPGDYNSDFWPARLTRAEAIKIANKTGFRLPYEKEWEYACRGGTKTLFVFGDTLPKEELLEQWLSWDFYDIAKQLANPFGLYGIFVGEWCNDNYTMTYGNDAKKEKNSYVIRGGGAIFLPWQDREWIWCVSAMRMSSKNLLEDGRCCLRLVYDLDL